MGMGIFWVWGIYHAFLYDRALLVWSILFDQEFYFVFSFATCVGFVWVADCRPMVFVISVGDYHPHLFAMLILSCSLRHFLSKKVVVERRGFEPLATSLQAKLSSWLTYLPMMN